MDRIFFVTVNLGLALAALGVAADTVAPVVARTAATVGPAVATASGAAATAVGTAVASYGPQAAQVFEDFNAGMENPTIPQESFTGKLSQLYSALERMMH